MRKRFWAKRLQLRFPREVVMAPPPTVCCHASLAEQGQQNPCAAVRRRG